MRLIPMVPTRWDEVTSLSALENGGLNSSWRHICWRVADGGRIWGGGSRLDLVGGLLVSVDTFE